jgi:hypothetical protein
LTAFFFFFYLRGVSGQLTRTTTIPHGPLDILQAQEQVRHRGGDRRTHRGSNPRRRRNKSHGWPQQLDPQVLIDCILFLPVAVFMSITHNSSSKPSYKPSKFNNFVFINKLMWWIFVCASMQVEQWLVSSKLLSTCGFDGDGRSACGWEERGVDSADMDDGRIFLH